MKKFLPFLVAALVASALCSASAAAATVTNGGFESGFDGWTIADAPGSLGQWLTTADTELPISGNTALAPANGMAAVVDQDDTTSSVLYQDIKLEPEANHQLSFNYWYDNQEGAWLIPDPLGFQIPDDAVQMIRIDLTRPGSDPLTGAPGDILRTIVAPSGSDPVNIPWTPVTTDLSEFAGQTVRLRFADMNNVFYLHLGVDDVAVTTTPWPAVRLKITKTAPKSYRLKQGRQGVKVSYSLSRAASVTAVLQKPSAGRMTRGKCAKPAKKNKKGKRCTRWTKLSTSTLQGAAGVNIFSFNGKVRGKRLAAGKYRISLTARTETTTSVVRNTSFTVKKAKKKH